FHPGLDIPQVELVIRKGYRNHIDSYSAFRENDRKTPTGLAGYLRERGFERVTVCGLATDFCVFFSAVDAVAAGFETAIALEASRAIDVDGAPRNPGRCGRMAGAFLARSRGFTLSLQPSISLPSSAVIAWVIARSVAISTKP